jgi:hypothetical protein
MPNVSSRPPLSEGAANAIASDIKSSEARGQTSEVPLAFQTAPASDKSTMSISSDAGRSGLGRHKLPILALIVVVLVLAVWAAA